MDIADKLLYEMAKNARREGRFLPDGMCAVMIKDLRTLIVDYRRIEYELKDKISRNTNNRGE